MTVPAAPSRHDLYDVAFLAGGPVRVVDTAVVALVRAGRIRIASPGQLATAGGRAAMTDTRLWAEVFERPSTALVPGRPGRRSRSVDHSDPRLRAYRPGGPAATAGGHALF